MSTNKLVLRSIDEQMADYTPIYQPIYPLFLGKSQQYSEEVGKINFKRLEAVGDIRARHITPKDTDIRQIAVKEGQKTFKKYFMANEFAQSSLQDSQQVEDVNAQVLDEHQKQMDELLLLGDGTASNNVANNGLFWSADSNWVEESSSEIDTDADPLIGLHAKVIEKSLDANLVSGRKLIMFYGADVLAKFNSLYASQPVPFKRVLAEVLGGNYSFAEMPADVTPANSSGFIIANMDQTKLHYTTLPGIHAQGVDERKMEVWTRFLMGSCMLEVLASGAVIKQPLTFEA